MIAADDFSVNVKELLESISNEQDTIFKLYKNGQYTSITYKQMMSEILADRTQVTVSEMLQLIHERVDGVIDDHVYYSKAAAS
jgi:hypothetical protein